MAYGVEDLRNELAKLGDEYRRALEVEAENRETILRKIMVRLLIAKADDPPQKSHWIVAQCKEILSPMYMALTTINRYEELRDRLASREQAQQGGRDGEEVFPSD